MIGSQFMRGSKDPRSNYDVIIERLGCTGVFQARTDHCAVMCQNIGRLCLVQDGTMPSWEFRIFFNSLFLLAGKTSAPEVIFIRTANVYYHFS